MLPDLKMIMRGGSVDAIRFGCFHASLELDDLTPCV
jgi:hypothetical protein